MGAYIHICAAFRLHLGGNFYFISCQISNKLIKSGNPVPKWPLYRLMRVYLARNLNVSSDWLRENESCVRECL